MQQKCATLLWMQNRRKKEIPITWFSMVEFLYCFKSSTRQGKFTPRPRPVVPQPQPPPPRFAFCPARKKYNKDEIKKNEKDNFLKTHCPSISQATESRERKMRSTIHSTTFLPRQAWPPPHHSREADDDIRLRPQ